MVEEEVEKLDIFIDIKGAVINPGVYQMVEGERIQDAIDKAGGVTEEADLDQVNKALKVYDEMVIYIPKEGEQLENVLLEINDGKISINQSGLEQLQKLNGIGPAKAEAIIDYREEHGNFKTIEELMNVSGIGEKTFEQIKEDITIN